MVPVFGPVRIVAREVGNVTPRLQTQRLVRHAILGRTAGGLGVVVRHGPDMLAGGRVHDPAVIEGSAVFAPQFAHRIDLDVGAASHLKTDSLRAIGIGSHNSNGSRVERGAGIFQPVIGYFSARSVN